MKQSTIELKTKNLENVLHAIHPKKIAVAFLGQGYKKFVTPQELESIIISPTEGSNPYAIQQLAKDIGWEKIFFLRKLHAKIYIGKKETLIGSANLSHNGLSDDKGTLQEACVKIPTTKNVLSTYKHLLSDARKEFKDESAKKKALAELFKIWGKRITAGLEKQKSNNVPSFKNYDLLANDSFFLEWFMSEDPKPDLKKDVNLNCSIFKDWLYLSNEDKIEENDWILYWKRDNSGKFPKNGKLSWMYVHHIFSEVLSYGKYNNLAIEFINKDRPHVPFRLTKNFKDAFALVINQEKYKAFRKDDKYGEDPFVASSPKLKKLLPQLIKDIKDEMK